MSIIVAGAGLAGLTAAARLAEAGREVTVVEERAEVGGRVRTREVDGFTLDRGFQVLFDAYPAVREELDLDDLDLREFAPGGTICRPGERSTLSDPLRDPGSLLASLATTEVTFADKLATLRLRARLGGFGTAAPAEWPEFGEVDERAAGQSIRAYLRDVGFSAAFVNNFAAPLYGGITLDRSLSTAAEVFAYTFRAMSLGSISVPADGMQAIPRQLAERATDAGAEVRLRETVESVRHEDREGVLVETDAGTHEGDALVLATDPNRASDLTGLDSIPTGANGVVTQHYRLPGPDLDAGSRILLNAAGAGAADAPGPNTVAQTSAAAPEYTPADSDDALLVASFLGETARETDDADLAGQARQALGSWYPERRFGDLELLGTDRIEFAQFPQPPGSHHDLPDTRDPAGPVYLAGDFTRWSSIQGAMESGRRAAEAVLDDVR